MKCAEAKLMFSPYLDGAVSGTEMHSLGSHLNECSHCHREYALLRQTQELLAKVGRPKAPADLALKLRVAISREAAATRHPRLEGLLVRLENALHAFMVPATAGTIAAIAIFGFAVGTGNTMIVKPSEQVPLSMKRMFELLEKCDLPPGVVNLVNGGREVVGVLGDPIIVDSTKPTEDAVRTATQAFATQLEDRIRANPQLWYQFYPYWPPANAAQAARVGAE